MKKLDDMQSEKVSGGAKFTGYDAKKGHKCICAECGKKYFTPGLRWDELGPMPVDIKYQFDYCHECLKKKFPTGYEEADVEYWKNWKPFVQKMKE